jgi:hypothetical protein
MALAGMAWRVHAVAFGKYANRVKKEFITFYFPFFGLVA